MTETRHVRDRRRTLRPYVTGAEMSDERIEARVLRNDVEVACRILAAQPADVIGDVEVERVVPGAVEEDVLDTVTQGLHRSGHVDSDLLLVRAEKQHDLEVAFPEQAEILGLHVLEIDEDVVRSHRASVPVCSGSSGLVQRHLYFSFHRKSQ
ncbi:MAG: hypothetical protein HY943_22800 [Gammaproteobacteria bacterium]|nr:hypothetical protein [Gammaproteobacteria bacterium]